MVSRDSPVSQRRFLEGLDQGVVARSFGRCLKRKLLTRDFATAFHQAGQE